MLLRELNFFEFNVSSVSWFVLPDPFFPFFFASLREVALLHLRGSPIEYHESL